MRRPLLRWLPLAAFLVLLAFLGIGLQLKPREVPSPLLNKAMPVFSLPTLAQPAQSLSPQDLRGQVWLLNVWASWCVACQSEHPLLVDFSKRHAVPLIGLNYKDRRDEALRWLGRTQRRHLQTLQAEARERQAEAALRQDIEASIQVGLCVIHPDGRIHHVNREFCKISGWSEQELIGDSAGGRAPPYPFWPRDQVARLDDDLRKILAAEAGVDRYRETDVRPDGTLWTAQLSAHRLHGRKDWLFTCVDVSREVAAQERSDALDAQWRDARPIHSMGMHSGNLLHQIAGDLGTYRAAIDGLALHLKAGRYDMLAKGVQHAEEAAQRMDATVKPYQDLLRNKITREPTSLRQAVEDAMAQVHHHAAQHNVEIDPNGVSKALPLILVERGMLCDVLINLLDNAISAMEKTAVLNRRIGIESYLDEKAGQVHLRVRDHGPGVPPDLREKVFTHGHSTRKGGHGWGLYPCRLWAKEKGGSLAVQDNSPCGATFVLILPLNPTPPVEAPSHADVSPPA